MKHDAIVGQGYATDCNQSLGDRRQSKLTNVNSIPIHERVELPEDLIPEDSRVEIDAKITAGYFTQGKRMTEEELRAVQGRLWEE